LCRAQAIVVVPTLHGGEALRECVESLIRQDFPDFAVIVVDNSGRGVARELCLEFPRLHILENTANVGFGGAINQGAQASESEFVATLNDDALASTGWLSALVQAIEPRYEIGMCASRVLLEGGGAVDSAGMLLCGDGSSRQRGHAENPDSYARGGEALFPSGSAALYRRAMLDEVGGFDEDFFLYCEDTDLGLRARWAAWECVYVPEAVVEHRYSLSAGRASAMKAFYVERNRLYVAAKNFPAAMLWRLPFVSLVRYAWHAYYGLRGSGTAGQFFAGGGGMADLVRIVCRAHLELWRHRRVLAAKRRAMKHRLNPAQFMRLVSRFAIIPRKVAAL
jgi:GT2 family glycosyltransferase